MIFANIFKKTQPLKLQLLKASPELKTHLMFTNHVLSLLITFNIFVNKIIILSISILSAKNFNHNCCNLSLIIENIMYFYTHILVYYNILLINVLQMFSHRFFKLHFVKARFRKKCCAVTYMQKEVRKSSVMI